MKDVFMMCSQEGLNNGGGLTSRQEGNGSVNESCCEQGFSEQDLAKFPYFIKTLTAKEQKLLIDYCASKRAVVPWIGARGKFRNPNSFTQIKAIA